jgi:hypothetical protein
MPSSTRPPPSPTPTPVPSRLTQAELKYEVVRQVSRPIFCDPDKGLSVAEEQARAVQRFPEIQRDGPTFLAILSQLRVPASGAYTPQQQAMVYREWKMLNAVRLQPAGGNFRFGILVPVPNFARPGGDTVPVDQNLVEGIVDPFGGVTVERRTRSDAPACAR